MPIGVATPTIGMNAVVPFSYAGTAAVQALNFGFIPSACEFWLGTISWAWVRGLGFGVVFASSGSNTTSQGALNGVLDILDGSGVASANVGTTSTAIGLLIGTNTIVNNGGGTYLGLLYR